MAGNRAGGLKSARKIKKRYGENYYKNIGSIPHRRVGGFGSNSKLAKEAGRKGGKNSKKGFEKWTYFKIENILIIGKYDELYSKNELNRKILKYIHLINEIELYYNIELPLTQSEFKRKYGKWVEYNLDKKEIFKYENMYNSI